MTVGLIRFHLGAHIPRQVLAGEYDKARIRGEMEALNKANPVLVYAQVRFRFLPLLVVMCWGTPVGPFHPTQTHIHSTHRPTIIRTPNPIPKVTCPYCKKAKELLTSLGASYKVVEVDALGQDGFAYRVELNEMTGRSTVPNIFVVRCGRDWMVMWQLCVL